MHLYSDGYSTQLLKSVLNNGTNILFVVPLQEQLSIEPLPFDSVEFAKMPQPNCMKCGKKISPPLLPLHVEECKVTETVGSNGIGFFFFSFLDHNAFLIFPLPVHFHYRFVPFARFLSQLMAYLIMQACVVKGKVILQYVQWHLSFRPLC